MCQFIGAIRWNTVLTVSVHEMCLTLHLWSSWRSSSIKICVCVTFPPVRCLMCFEIFAYIISQILKNHLNVCLHAWRCMFRPIGTVNGDPYTQCHTACLSLHTRMRMELTSTRQGLFNLNSLYRALVFSGAHNPGCQVL